MQAELYAEEIGYRKWLPEVKRIEDLPVETNSWDIPYTIGQLSYLTHSHYRYYGKFPSAVAAQILEEFGPSSKRQYVLDNFCGSGTTLVEAKLRGMRSYGIDISWISALVSNVKTRHVNLAAIKASVLGFLRAPVPSSEFVPLELTFAERWFSSEVISDLRSIQTWIFRLPPSPEREFILIGFLAIIRRVSRAHDAEVRPHIKADKKERRVLPAFKKKMLDMIEAHGLFQQVTHADVDSCCYVANNVALPNHLHDQACGLIISHPPYLNSFNYRPVFSLEFFWGSPFEAEFVPAGTRNLIKDELLAHPANENITSAYFAHLGQCYAAAFLIQPPRGKLAIVIGDCTRTGKLIPVVDTTIERVTSLGYRLVQKNYRSTHYGLGKYAYAHRADYHGDNVEKKDAILVFEK
jgi:SAM-dependent methyltransferase